MIDRSNRASSQTQDVGYDSWHSHHWHRHRDHTLSRSSSNSHYEWGDWYDRQKEQASSNWWDRGVHQGTHESRSYSQTSWVRQRCCSEDACCDWWKQREGETDNAWSGSSSSSASSGGGTSARRINSTPRRLLEQSTRHDDARERQDEWPDEIRDFNAKYELGGQIASGHRGSVHLAKERLSGQTLVVKKLQNTYDTSEYDLLVQKRHPNIIQVFECFCGWRENYVIMEWCSGGDLFNAVRSLGKPTELWSARIFKQLLSGIRYLHDSFRESHNDIKPENLLLDRSPHDVCDVPRVTLADFGCATLANSVTQKRGGGDPRYRAPETFQGSLLGFATDVWAVGVVLYEILSGGYLIYTQEQNIHSFRAFRKHNAGDLCRRYMQSLVSKQPVDVSTLCGSAGRDLLANLLHLDPQRRATVHEACVHAWMKATDEAQQKGSFESLSDVDCAPPASPSKKNARGGC